MNVFEGITDEIKIWGAVLLLSLLGRLVFHIQQVRKGLRTMVSKDLLLELPIALAMGFVAKGVCSYYGLSIDVTFALAIVISHQGPRLFDAAADGLITKWTGKDESTPKD